jgi:alpha-2-macroglobulin
VRVLRWASRFWTGVLAATVLLAALLLGLRALLPLFSPAPTLVDSDPGDGAADVSTRARLTLRFDRPMNPPSVEHALALAPPVEWKPLWSDDRATLTISPTRSLRPNAEYQLSIGDGAQSRSFRALAEPSQLRFRTAPAPAVVQVLPADGAANVPLESPISIRFSRTIVSPDGLMRPGALPELRFDPPIAGEVIWLDQATALFRPAAPLTPGTRYRAAIAANLADIAGGQLDSPFEWSFSTPAPRVLDVWPPRGARMVAPTATLALTLSQSLDLDSVRASLTISPTTAGDLGARLLPDGRQVIVYAPFAGWEPGASYSIAIGAGAAPVAGNLPLLEPARVAFTVAPRPALIARFPGEGQTLPAGQAISLVFNTPMDEAAFRDTVKFEPAASDVQVRTVDTEVRIVAGLSAATVYTLTLPAALADRNGIPLGQEHRIRFATAPAGPALALPEAPDHLAQIVPGRVASLLVRRTNLSALTFDLYRLDEVTVVRMLGFGERDWTTFQPERYGQPLLRSWPVSLADPLNTPSEDRVPLAAKDGTPLPAGAYYLRLRALEGPRADVLLMVSRARLAIQGVDPAAPSASALVWATDVISGTPIEGLPIGLYQSAAPLAQSMTDATGLARFTRARGAPLARYIAIAGGGQFGVASGAWGAPGHAARDTHMVFVTTDRAAYRAGESVRLAGFARSTEPGTGTLGLPREREIVVTVRPLGPGQRIYQETLTLGPTGVFSATVPLAAGAAAGDYALVAAIDGTLFQSQFTVVPSEELSVRLGMQMPPPIAAGDAARVDIAAESPEGLPIAGVVISWTLETEPIAPPASGYVFGDDDQAPVSTPIAKGTSQTDANGRYTLVVSDTAGVYAPLRFYVRAQVAVPGGATATAAGSFVVSPGPAFAGIRLPSRIFAGDRSGAVELLALGPDGQPAAGTPLRIEVLRRTWERVEPDGPSGAADASWRPIDRSVLTRRSVTGPDGQSRLTLRLPSAGTYRVRVNVENGTSQAASATTLYATTPGFTGWGEQPGGGPLLLADRPSYRPGETATLLLTSPIARSDALVSIGASGSVDGEMRAIRAGVPFTLTLGADVAADVPVSVLLAPPQARANDAAAAPSPALLAETILPVEADRHVLAVTVTSNRQAYAPGATATLIVTTTDAAGAGVPADVTLSVVGAPAAPRADITTAIRPPAPDLITAPALPSRLPAPPAPRAPRPDSAAAPARSIYWDSALRTGPNGVLTVTVDLPDEPIDMRAIGWAASADRFGQGQATLEMTQALTLSIEAPQRLRAGDQIDIGAEVRNTSTVSREVELSLSAAGVRLRDGVAPLRRLTLAAGERARAAWPAVVLDAPVSSVSIGARVLGEPPLTDQLRAPILPAAPDRVPHDGGVALLREYLDPQTGQPLDVARLSLGQLVRARLTAVVTASPRSLIIQEALPAGAVLVSADAGGDFERVTAEADQLVLERGVGQPGIYQHSYLLRFVAAGRFGVPAPIARAQGGEVGVGNTMLAEVAAGPTP